jgi:hypothetical protein
VKGKHSAFGSTDKVSRAVLSLAVYARHVNLFFVRGRSLPDPHALLRGEGNQVRHLRLAGPGTLDDPRVEALVAEAVDRSDPPFSEGAAPRMIIKSVAARQRPRRLTPSS